MHWILGMDVSHLTSKPFTEILPLELVLWILKFCSFEDLRQLRQTNSYLRELADTIARQRLGTGFEKTLWWKPRYHPIPSSCRECGHVQEDGYTMCVSTTATTKHVTVWSRALRCCVFSWKNDPPEKSFVLLRPRDVVLIDHQWPNPSQKIRICFADPRKPKIYISTVGLEHPETLFREITVHGPAPFFPPFYVPFQIY